MRILITGSEGLIGKILFRALASDYELFTLYLRSVKSPTHFVCDLSCWEEAEKVFREINYLDAVIHLAADPRPGAPWDSILKNNIIATRNVYEGARMAGAKRVIYTSSNRVTEGDVNDNNNAETAKPISVDDPMRPISYYGASKVFGEALGRMFWEAYGLKSICIRIGNVRHDDDPTKNQKLARKWLSHRDLVDLFRKSITAPVSFGVYYGVSANQHRLWDIQNAKRDLGYEPKDDAYSKKHG